MKRLFLILHFSFLIFMTLIFLIAGVLAFILFNPNIELFLPAFITSLTIALFACFPGLELFELINKLKRQKNDLKNS